MEWLLAGSFFAGLLLPRQWLPAISNAAMMVAFGLLLAKCSVASNPATQAYTGWMLMAVWVGVWARACQALRWLFGGPR